MPEPMEERWTFRVFVTEKPPCGRRLCVFRLRLLGGIYRYIFTIVGSASLKLSVDSAGRTISFSPV